jgi:hypothetical protein
MDWPLIIIVGIAALALVIFFVRNLKDEKKFEKQVENDYQKSRREEGDIEIDKKKQ